MCTRGSSRSATRRSSTRRRARNRARRPFFSTSIRSEWSGAGAAKAALRTSTSTTGRTSRRRCSRSCFRAGSTPRWAADASRKPELAASRVAARGAARGCSLPRRRSVPPRVVRASRLHGRSDPPRTRREHAGARAEPAVHGYAASSTQAERPADAPVRARSGSRRSEALLGRGRRGREAASSRRGLARQPSVARCDRLALSRASARARSRRHCPADGGGTARGRGRGSSEGRAGGVDRADDQPERTPPRRRVRGAEGFWRFDVCSIWVAARASSCAACWPISSSRRSSAWTCPAESSIWRNRA